MAVTGELVSGTDNIGEFEKKVKGIKAAKKFKSENPEAEEKLEKLLDEKKITKSNTRTKFKACLLYTSPSPRDVEESRMPSSA